MRGRGYGDGSVSLMNTNLEIESQSKVPWGWFYGVLTGRTFLPVTLMPIL